MYTLQWYGKRAWRKEDREKGGDKRGDRRRVQGESRERKGEGGSEKKVYERRRKGVHSHITD